MPAQSPPDVSLATVSAVLVDHLSSEVRMIRQLELDLDVEHVSEVRIRQVLGALLAASVNSLAIARGFHDSMRRLDADSPITADMLLGAPNRRPDSPTVAAIRAAPDRHSRRVDLMHRRPGRRSPADIDQIHVDVLLWTEVFGGGSEFCSPVDDLVDRADGVGVERDNRFVDQVRRNVLKVAGQAQFDVQTQRGRSCQHVVEAVTHRPCCRLRRRPHP